MFRNFYNHFRAKTMALCLYIHGPTIFPDPRAQEINGLVLDSWGKPQYVL